jgi:hypothetical protein
MRRLGIAVAISFGIAVLTGACDKGANGEEGTGSEAPSEGGEQAAPETARGPALSFVPVESMGLEIEMPEGATVNAGAGESVMISASGNCTVMLAPVTEISPSYESTVGSIERGMAGGELQEMLRNEQTEGGWVIEYQAASRTSGDTRYGVSTRVTVGGQQYDCTRVTRTPEDAACILRACQSLRPAQ